MSRKPPNKAEAARIARMLEMGCICCRVSYDIKIPAECHHIVEGRKRLGHWYSLPLCSGHHRGAWSHSIRAVLRETPSIHADGKGPFNKVYGSERLLWERVQVELNLPAEWPASKILPRRLVA